MGRSGDPQGAQHPDLAATQPELTEDFLLTPSQQGPDPAEASSYLEVIDLELRPCRRPASNEAVGEVFCHARMIPKEKS